MSVWKGGVWGSQQYPNGGGPWRGGVWRSQQRVPIWTPATLFADGQQGVWYEPKPEYLFQDAAGTIAVTADGDPVGYMADLSGNGNAMEQGSSASRMLFGADGRPLLFADGVDDFMTSQSAVNANQAWSICYAIEPDGYTGGGLGVTGGLDARAAAGQQIRVSDTNTLGVFVYHGEQPNRTEIAESLGAPLGELQIHAFTYDPSTGRSRFWINGEKKVDTIVSMPSATGTAKFVLGSQRNFELDSNVKGFYGPSVALVSAISESEMENLIHYVAGIAGVTL